MRFNESATNYLSGTRWRAAAAAAKTAVQQDTEQQQQWQQHSVRLNVVYLVCHKYVDYAYTPFSIKHQVLEILGCETTHSAKQKRGENSDTNEKREHSGDRTIDLIYMRRCCCPAVEYYYWGCYSCYCSSLAAWLLRGCPCCTHAHTYVAVGFMQISCDKVRPQMFQELWWIPVEYFKPKL